MNTALDLIEKVKDQKQDRWNAWEMVNVRPDSTGLPTYIHCYQGPLRHGPRIKVQIGAGPPNARNSVSVSIHDPDIVEGRKNLVSRFRNSYHHSLTKEFIIKNRQLLLAHANKEIDDQELLGKVVKI